MSLPSSSQASSGVLTTALERLEKQIEKVEKQIDDVEKQINGTQKQIDECEKQFDTCQDPIQRTSLDKKIEHLRNKEEQLRKEKEQLRKEKEQLRKKENLLLQQQQQQVSVTAASTSQVSKRSREDMFFALQQEYGSIANIQSALLTEAEQSADPSVKNMKLEEARNLNRQMDLISQHMEALNEEMNEQRKRAKLPGITSPDYFTHADVDSERWFKKLLVGDKERRAANSQPIIQAVAADGVLGPVDPSLSLRAALRYSCFRLLQSTSVCHPTDDRCGNDTVGWLREQKEPKWQWPVLQLLRAAAGNQMDLRWELEDKSQPEPREDLRGFIGVTKVSSGELKKRLAKSVEGNAEGFGQLIRYGARDKQRGDYLSVLTTLNYFIFVRISYANENEVERFLYYPPFSHLLDVMMMDFEAADPHATRLQRIVPYGTPAAFTLLVRFMDNLCRQHSVDITPPRFYRTVRGSPGVEEEWLLSHDQVQVLHQTARSLIIGADHWDPSAGVRVVIKIAKATSLQREELIHSMLDGKVANIRQLEAKVRIDGASETLYGIVLSPLGSSLTSLPLSALDGFLHRANVILSGMHTAGVVHRDVKPGNFLLRGSTLLLNDFDMSCPASSADNQGFMGGTSRFASPFLSPTHCYTANDDCLSLAFTALELVRKDIMDGIAESTERKKQVLQQIATGELVITGQLRDYVAQTCSLLRSPG